ncbi:MAG: SCO family protein [Gammaproteobacteria bacterium]|nr:SCO family protein [Gammaproteobacteria bacterium]
MRLRRRRHSPWAKLVLFAIGIAIFYGSYYLGSQHAPAKSRFLNLREFEKPLPIRDLALLDQYGNPFNERQLIGHWNLIIFGYTGNPESVRDGLTLITHIKNRLALYPDIQRKIRGVLISADPDNDRPEVLNTFMAQFSPDYLALTGKNEDIQAAAKMFDFTIRRSDTAGPNGHRIDHSSSILLIDPAANQVGLFTGVVDATSIAADLELLALNESE